jgi:putative heme-binding domain-containing protein
MTALAAVFEALEGRGRPLDTVTDADTRTRLGLLVVVARVLAADEQAPAAERLAAVHLVGRAPGRGSAELDTLARLLAPQQAAALQSAAVTALGRIADERATVAVLAGWAGASPALKSQMLDLLLSRADGQRRLLDAVAANVVPAGQIDAARRQRLLSLRDVALRDRAARLLGVMANSERAKVLNDYQDVLKLAGDTKRGQAVFGLRCAACHQFQGTGHAVGPDLAALTNKSPEYLLQEILDPNRNVDSRYVEYRATTKAGRTFIGLLAAETAVSITLRGQEHKDEVLLRADLDRLEDIGRSPMPEGMERDLSRQDLADLIAYLIGGKAPPSP